MDTRARIISAAVAVASVSDVVKRIKRRIFNPSKQKEMAEKVEEYDRTKDPRHDIDLHESKMIYPVDEMGDEFDVMAGNGKSRDLEIQWTSHSQYRSELRDVDSGKVNDAILDLIEKRPDYKNREKVKVVKPFGKIVVDIDGRRPGDVEADVITVMS
jgi:hypothetical protein